MLCTYVTSEISCMQGIRRGNCQQEERTFMLLLSQVTWALSERTQSSAAAVGGTLTAAAHQSPGPSLYTSACSPPRKEVSALYYNCINVHDIHFTHC